MVRGSSQEVQQEKKAGVFFMATLVMWAVSVFFEILFNKRTELVPVVGGFFFFQSANWVVRNWVSRDPLFVNTCISLLHSSLTSASGLHRGRYAFIIFLPSLFDIFAYSSVTIVVLVCYVCLLIFSWVQSPVNVIISFAIPSFFYCILGSRGYFVVLIMVNQWMSIGSDEMFEHSQLVGHAWPWAYPALCFSSGYFAYDQWDMLMYRLYSGLIPSILMHHLILLVCFTLALYRNVTINYLILTLICELHSIFLHVRKVRRMAGVRDFRSKFVKAEWFLNVMTFVFARLTAHVVITVKLIKDAPKFGKGVELPLALFGMAGMNLLNIFLGIDLFKAYRREGNPRSQQQNHEE